MGYVLMNMLSRVRTRSGQLVVGNLSLNLSGVPSQCVGLPQLLRALLPAHILIPLSIKRLESRPFSPKKDNERNRLCAGEFQVPQGTHITVDERSLTTGKLQDIGCRNL